MPNSRLELGSNTVSSRDSDRIYKALKRMIVMGELAPGAVLDERQLVEQFGVSRTPLREAFSRLREESLVVSVPRRGTFVADLSLSKLQDIHEIRVHLAELCGRLAAKRITDAELAELDRLIAKGATADTNPKIAGMLFDLEFHDIIYRATKNQELRHIMHRLDNVTGRVSSLSDQDHLAEQIEEHIGIYQALREHDAELAKQRLRKHVEAFSEFVAKILSR